MPHRCPECAPPRHSSSECSLALIVEREGTKGGWPSRSAGQCVTYSPSVLSPTVSEVTDSAVRTSIETAVEDDVEIVIGFVAPLGSDVDAAERSLRDSLTRYDYRAETIWFSDFLAVPPAERAKGYYASHMDVGDSLRRQSCRGDILAGLLLAALRDKILAA